MLSPTLVRSRRPRRGAFDFDATRLRRERQSSPPAAIRPHTQTPTRGYREERASTNSTQTNARVASDRSSSKLVVVVVVDAANSQPALSIKGKRTPFVDA